MSFTSSPGARLSKSRFLHAKIRTKRPNCWTLFRETFLAVPLSNLLLNFKKFNRIHEESVYFRLIGGGASTPSN